MSELYFQNQKLQQRLGVQNQILEMALDHIYFCRECDKMKNKYNCDTNFLFCEICNEQGLCYECTIKYGLGELCPHCHDQWICDKCNQATIR